MHLIAYIKISVPTSELSEKAYKRIESKATFHEKDQKTIASYYIRLGRFSHTTRNRLSFVEHQQQQGICYITTKGNLSFL